MIGLSSNSTKVKVLSEKDCVQTVAVELPASKVKDMIEKAFQDVQSQARLPGFRPGRIPIELIKKNFQQAAYSYAQDNLLREGVAEAIKSKNIHALQSPVIQSAKFDPEKPFQFEFTVEVAPAFKVSNYKGLKLNRNVAKKAGADLETNLKSLAEANARLNESKAEIVEKNHFVLINYEGFVEDKAIEGTKTENFLMDLSAPQAISGLAEGIVGSKVQDEKDISVEFPADSPAKHLAGKKGHFKVKITAIKERQVPVIDDEFAKDLGFESLDKLKERISQDLAKEAARRERRDLEKQIIDKLLEEHAFQVPKTLVDSQAKHLDNRRRYNMAQQGVPKEDQDQMMEGQKAEIQVQAEREVRLAFILNAISKAENLDVTEMEISAKIDDVLRNSTAQDKASLEKALRGNYKEQIGSDLRDTKIFDYLIAQAKIKDVTGEAK